MKPSFLWPSMKAMSPAIEHSLNSVSILILNPSPWFLQERISRSRLPTYALLHIIRSQKKKKITGRCGAESSPRLLIQHIRECVILRVGLGRSKVEREKNVRHTPETFRAGGTELVCGDEATFYGFNSYIYLRYESLVSLQKK